MNKKSKVEVISFGFKYGENPPSDLQLDLRNRIKNPQSHLPKGAVGTQQIVKKTVLGNPQNKKILERYQIRVLSLLKQKNELTTISFGCRSGIHRSVVFAEELAVRLRKLGFEVKVTHQHLK